MCCKHFIVVIDVSLKQELQKKRYRRTYKLQESRMNWDEDIDFLASNKKSAAKQGRRAGVPQSPDTQELSLENAIDVIEGPQGPGRVRKAGKWADEGSKSARKNSTNLIEQERFQDTRRDDSDDDDIPIIPDMDDLQDDILTLHEAKAPTVSVNKATYKELDSELVSLQRGQRIANVGNINLSFLTSKLYPEKEIKEKDELWTMEDLYENLKNINK